MRRDAPMIFRMTFLAGLLSSSPLCAQTPAAPPVVYAGATVRALVPSLGPGWRDGEFAYARVQGGSCLGIAVRLQGDGGPISLVMLNGIKQLEVDRRTCSAARGR
jgi:hypothetical protein